MDNANRPHDSDRNVSADDYNIRSTTHTRSATPEEVAYRNGYTEAQLREQNRMMRAYNNRGSQSDSTSAGVLIGILLASAIGIIVGAFYWVSQTDDVVVPVVAPEPTEPEAENDSPNVIERNTTVIERTVDRAQEVVPTEPPNVQITLPEAQNEGEAPAQTTSPAPDASADEATPAPSPEEVPSQ